MVMRLSSIRSAIKPYVPRKAFPILIPMYRAYMRILCWYVGLRDERYMKQTEFARLPSASLRYRVHGSPNIDSFLQVGKRCSQDIRAALLKIGKDLGSFQHILDFGCGCGRVLMWFLDHSQSQSFYGTDIDADAISWCRDNLDYATFSVNGALPPLEYPAGMFDLIYAISVFTHLNEDNQFQWLNELRRVAKSKGILLLTVHGSHCWENLPREDVAKIVREGFNFTATKTMEDIFPKWYQVAYHTKEYILDRYGQYFTILDYIPRGLNDHQDMVILQSPE
jgi:ubiquinone/menaquinone biosynthesis C-methylase UbiE